MLAMQTFLCIPCILNLVYLGSGIKLMRAALYGQSLLLAELWVIIGWSRKLPIGYRDWGHEDSSSFFVLIPLDSSGVTFWNLSLLVGVISKFLGRYRAVCRLPTITCVFANSRTYTSRHTIGVPNLLREMRYQHTLQHSLDNLKSGRPGIPQANIAAVATQRSFHITVNSHHSLKQNRAGQELRIADSKDSPCNCLPKWTRPNK